MKHRVLVALGARTTWLDVEADSNEVAAQLAARGGGRVLQIVPQRAVVERTRARFTLGVFLQEALTLLHAGLNIVEVLQALHDKEADAGFRRVLSRMLTRLREGASFSVAMGEQGPLFAPILVAGVAASETAGGLATTLERFLEYDRRIEQIRRKVLASAIYPLLLLIVGGGVILFLVAYVVPKFASILDGSGRAVGMGTKALLWAGTTINGHPFMLMLMLAALIGSVVWLVTQPQGRLLMYGMAARTPVLSAVLVNLGLSRFYRTLSLLLHSGIPLVQALEMVRGVLSPKQSQEVGVAVERLRSGQKLSESLADSSMVPPIAGSLLRVGEQSGALPAMSDKLADFLDLELDRRVEAFSRLFEPLLMTLIGFVIGAIVVLMYAPIFDMVGNVG